MPIYGGPTYDGSTDTGYRVFGLPDFLGFSAGNGFAVGGASFRADGVTKGNRAVWWDASAGAAELAGLTDDGSGDFDTVAYAVNSSGVSVGYADMFGADGSSLGLRAVRWSPYGDASELENLGTDATGYTLASAFAINESGVVVGNSAKYLSGYNLGSRAVRWDASGAATELGIVSPDKTGGAGEFAAAYAVNQHGDAVGFATQYKEGTLLGYRAVRWDASTVDPLELEILGMSSDGRTSTMSHALNDNRMAVGLAEKWDGDSYYGQRPVRWDASGAVTELGNLGVDANGVTFGEALAIDSAGVAVGYVAKYDAGVNKGESAVRWDLAGNATELGSLGSNVSGRTSSRAFSINDLGFVVGHTSLFTASGIRIGQRAVAWGPDGAAIELNDLIDADSGWVNLSEAYNINNSNWITGVGSFDPDGPGGERAYDRLFLMQIPQIPEPASAGLLACGLVALLCRRRGNGEMRS